MLDLTIEHYSRVHNRLEKATFFLIFKESPQRQVADCGKQRQHDIDNSGFKYAG
jgi:hypothetical protein